MQSNARRSAEEPAAASPAQPTILVVEDEPFVRETLTDLLAAEGYQVVAVGRGEEVFEVLEDVDLVLLDAMLPGRDGWQVCREIKTRHDPLLPVLMVTARTSPEDVVETFRAGADDYIAKPFNTAELAARIDTRLRVRRAEQALQDANERLRQLADQNYELYRQAVRDADERSLLLRELDHRVRNNISVILGLVAMERNRTPAREPGQALRSLDNRLRAFQLVYEMFRGGGYEGIESVALIDQVARRLHKTMVDEASVTIELDIESFLLSERQGFALALVANELISNAFQHAFPDGRDGHVRIELAREAGDARLGIRDDGVGLAAQPGDQPLGSGRSIVDALTRSELGGEVEASSVGAGTAVVVRFTLAPPESEALRTK